MKSEITNFAYKFIKLALLVVCLNLRNSAVIRVIIGGFRADIVSLIKLHMSVFLHGIRVKNSVKTLKQEVAKSRCDYHQEGSLMHYKIMGHLVP